MFFRVLHIYTQGGQTSVYRVSAKGDSEMVKLLVQAGADLELQRMVHTLWERFMLAHAVCDIAAWDEAIYDHYQCVNNEGASWNLMHKCKLSYGHTV